MSLSIIFQKTVNSDSSSPPITPLNITLNHFGAISLEIGNLGVRRIGVTALGNCQGRIAAARDPIGIAVVQRRGGVGTTGFRYWTRPEK